MEYRVRNQALLPAVVLAISGIGGGKVHAQDVQALVKHAVEVQINADQTDHSCWVFHEVDRKANGSVVQWVAQTHSVAVNRVMVKNGHPIPQAEQRRQVQSFIQDASAQARQQQDDKSDDERARSLLELLPVAFNWKVASHNQKTTTLAFSPKASFHPPTREASVFSAMQGLLVVENGADRIIEFKGHLIHDVDFGGGILGRLNKGGAFRIERSDLGNGIWDITQTHVHIEGHALIFKSISEQEDDIKSSFRREPDSVNLQQAASAVMSR